MNNKNMLSESQRALYDQLEAFRMGPTTVRNLMISKDRGYFGITFIFENWLCASLYTDARYKDILVVYPYENMGREMAEQLAKRLSTCYPENIDSLSVMTSSNNASLCYGDKTFRFVQWNGDDRESMPLCTDDTFAVFLASCASGYEKVTQEMLMQGCRAIWYVESTLILQHEWQRERKEAKISFIALTGRGVCHTGRCDHVIFYG
jgi:hypothetical protein